MISVLFLPYKNRLNYCFARCRSVLTSTQINREFLAWQIPSVEAQNAFALLRLEMRSFSSSPRIFCCCKQVDKVFWTKTLVFQHDEPSCVARFRNQKTIDEEIFQFLWGKKFSLKRSDWGSCECCGTGGLKVLRMN